MSDHVTDLHLRPDGSVDMEFYALRARERRQEYEQRLSARPPARRKAKRPLKILLGIVALVIDRLRKGALKHRG